MPSTLSAEEYLSVALLQVKAKDYDGAIESLTSGLENCSTTMKLTLLDRRASTYRKLENLKLAKVDAIQMMKIAKDDPRGYMRVGVILQNEGKDEVALKIFAKGLKDADTKHKDFNQLKVMHNALTRKMSPPKSVDPWTVLPIELVDMIVQRIGFRSLVRCLHVSKGWRNFIISQPTLWKEMDLTQARRNVNKNFVRNAIKRSQFKMKRASIHRFSDQNVFQGLFRTCKQLERVELLDGNFSNASIIEGVKVSQSLRTLHFGQHCKISADTVTQALRHCPTLNEVVVEQFIESPYEAFWDYDLPRLERLCLRGKLSPSMARINIRSLIQRAPNLRSLELSDFRRVNLRDHCVSLKSLTKLETLLARPESPFCDLPPSLKILEIDLDLWPITPADASGRREVAQLQNWLPNLEKLYLHSSDYATLWSAVHEFVECCNPTSSHDKPTPLKGLALEQTLRHDSLLKWNKISSTLFSKWKDSPRLAELDEFYFMSTNVTDETLGHLPAFLPHLTHLDLSSSYYITGAGIKDLVKAYEEQAGENVPISLMTLCVEDCESISPDAIEWASKNGVFEIKANKKEPKSGKRTRNGVFF